MIVDFTDIKREIKGKYDHKNLDDIVGQSTAERLAREICCDINNLLDKLNPGAKCYKVEVEECEGSFASYEMSEKITICDKEGGVIGAAYRHI